MRLFALTLALTATAQAAPLLQSKASVAEGNFCRTYTCQFVSRTVVAPETMHTLSFDYRVKGGTLLVGRLSNMEIISGSLYVPAHQWNTPVVRDFFRNFIGLTPEPATLRACVKKALSTGSSIPTPISSGTVSGVGYRAECFATKTGEVGFIVMDSRDLFR